VRAGIIVRAQPASRVVRRPLKLIVRRRVSRTLYPTTIAWSGFWASVAATWATYHFGWMLHTYFVWLSVAAVLSLALGLWVLWLVHFRRAAVVLVVLGLLVGQWWFWQLLLIMTFWRIRGFAP
jgi:hypothetical protein